MKALKLGDWRGGGFPLHIYTPILDTFDGTNALPIDTKRPTHRTRVQMRHQSQDIDFFPFGCLIRGRRAPVLWDIIICFTIVTALGALPAGFDGAWGQRAPH